MQDDKDKGKKKVAKEVVEEKPKTLAQKISDINNAKFTSDREAAIANRESKLKQQIAASKAKRGPSMASRISGLQGLRPGLGQQFQ
jgi:hypothetical protein